jgi:hypothetical protein
MTEQVFTAFPKIPRFSRDIIITEKIDGTNASVLINDTGDVIIGVGSRTRWITPEQDNMGFARFVREHQEDFLKLGPGHHFGEWWGGKIQRGYGLNTKIFSLFNTTRFGEAAKEGRLGVISVVPVLYQGPFSTEAVDAALASLHATGSLAAPGFMKPEGVVIFHVAGNYLFKKTLDGDAAKGV